MAKQTWLLALPKTPFPLCTPASLRFVGPSVHLFKLTTAQFRLDDTSSTGVVVEVLQAISLVLLHQISVSSTAATIQDAFSSPPFSFTHVCYSI